MGSVNNRKKTICVIESESDDESWMKNVVLEKSQMYCSLQSLDRASRAMYDGFERMKKRTLALGTLRGEVYSQAA